MNKITQDAQLRQSFIFYAKKHGVTAASRKYHISRPTIYYWMKRYDGTFKSLQNISSRPHHHPNQHTPQEIALVMRMRRMNKNDGLVILWVKLTRKGYKRNITSLYRVLRRLELKQEKLPNPKYVPKPYEQMQYPGQRIQIDVKVVPRVCIASKEAGQRYYQYTAIDEYSRWRFVEAFQEQSTYSSAVFLEHLIKAFPYKIECVQTDNGLEFVNSFNSKRRKTTLFQDHLESHGITHKLIRPFTPRHNGKVERSHRKDNERFYACHTFYSFEDFSKQLKRYNRENYNNFPMRPLEWKTPQQVLKSFLLKV